MFSIVLRLFLILSSLVRKLLQCVVLYLLVLASRLALIYPNFYSLLEC